MAKKTDRQIEYLPPGWRWVSAVPGRAKHAIDPSGRDVSLRQAQNMQRAAKEQLGIPKAAPQRRTGRVRTLTGGVPRQRKGREREGVGSLYDPRTHGEVKVQIYYDLESAAQDVAFNPIDKKFTHIIMQIRYTERLVKGKGVGSDELDKNGYATITPFRDASVWNRGARTNDANLDVFPNPWYQADQALKRYDMTGPGARIYLVLEER